jgi:hypothetical protein
MTLTAMETKYVRLLIEKELEHFKREEVTLFDVDTTFLKGEHEYQHFLEALLKKLK